MDPAVGIRSTPCISKILIFIYSGVAAQGDPSRHCYDKRGIQDQHRLLFHTSGSVPISDEGMDDLLL
jgi:hypothetical protein